MLKNVPIAFVKINQFFTDFSGEYGYDTEKYIDDLSVLIDKWIEAGCVEVYEFDDDRLFGRAKESDSDGQGRLVVEYIGIYHARLRPNFNDPLVVIKFSEDAQGKTYVSVRFISDHKQLFGDLDIKHNAVALKSLRQSVDAKIRHGNDKDFEDEEDADVEDQQDVDVDK
ncbi:hypothetical protein [Pantoea agglomerans]|uniref:hypothetical protein n=1 Tax=Enterobacter agglomerans TaxID=549 RepID=UPI00045C6AF0|nr:hypothetical protein [Pantoea agglomerans]KDA95397.1 hypothetical protein T296_03925 [Pantoea agglomerans Eh318]